jgi:alpha-mannosidase
MPTPSSPTVHLIGNAHIDPVWLWRWPEGFAETKATFRSALDRMKETPGYVFTCSAAAVYEWVEENDLAMFREVQRRVKQGRWVITGGWWIEPDCNVPCGESFVRQALNGQRYFRERFGVTCRAGYCVDSFGHAATLPKILAGCGYQGYVFMRPQAHENADIPMLAFRWQADDGSAVTALRIPQSYTAWTPDAVKNSIQHNVELVSETPLKDQVFAFYGVGNHGGGPTKEILSAIEGWRRDPEMPKLVYSSPEQFLDVAESAPLETWKGELQHHAPGCYSAVSLIKSGIRRAEQALLSAEMWDTAAQTALRNPPASRDLSRPWKHVLFNQFHDILPGTSVVGAYQDARDQLGGATYEASFARNAAQQALSWQIDTEGHDPPLVLFNNQPFPFEGVIETEDLGFSVGTRTRGELALADGNSNPIPHQSVEPHTICGRRRFVTRVSIPALGYRVLRQTTAYQNPSRRLLGKQAVRAKDSSIGNDRLRVSLDRRGYLVIHDRQTRRKVFDKAGAVPLVIEDTSDTWSHGVKAFRKVAGRFKRTSAEVIESGPVRGRISVSYAWGDSLLKLDFLLGAGEPFVTIIGRVDWRERFKALKLAFPVPYRADTWTAEIPYGTVARATNGDEEPIQQWMDLSAEGRGLAIANDSKYSASAEPGELRQTILRSPPYALHTPYTSDVLDQHAWTDQGPQEFRLALVPHDGDWRQSGVIEVARQLNRPVNTLPETYHDGPLPMVQGFVKATGKGIYVEAVKRSSSGDGWILRATEWFGRKRKAHFELPSIKRTWTASFRGNEVKTFLIPDSRRAAVREVNMLEE